MEDEKMKKNLVFFVAVVFLLIPIVAFGGKKEKKAPAPVEEKVEMGAAGGEIDPWILETRRGLEPYRGTIDPSFKGPDGQTPTWDTELVLTVADVEKIRKENYKVAFNMDGAQGEYHEAMTKGIRDACESHSLRDLLNVESGSPSGRFKRMICLGNLSEGHTHSLPLVHPVAG